ncbi:hypothetical protein ACFV1L_21805 [Kitasatospora sp. NPDC059646]|uniref:hypothetical protein n=1 Tax=Kitasatospora sp. NPDC059646 TaxID=3346893 RepID=UPI00369AC68D
MTDAAPPCTLTAEAALRAALAAHGLTAEYDDESMIGGERNTWLVVRHPHDPEPYLVLFLAEDGDEITVTRAPRPGDRWRVIACGSPEGERNLITRPAEQLAAVAEAAAAWAAAPAAAEFAGTDQETAEAAMVRALAARGITAHADFEAYMSGEPGLWLVVGHDQGNPSAPDTAAEPHAVLYLRGEGDDEIAVTRAPRPGDRWHLVVDDRTGSEPARTTYPAQQTDAVADAVAQWLALPLERPAA